ncbi:MAG TPA: poly(R)-hydroxyalkanoic acid synthase subunit PhaE [Casimicrobiaceae bacterium]|nr:poly(R)-hydroxyalkanoic acid synthase subunit PhaE [Casimicrobiaceae bacterium]
MDAARGAESVVDFWVGLIPQFFGNAAAGAAASGAGKTPSSLDGLVFPADAIAATATMTRQYMELFARQFGSMLQTAGWPSGASESISPQLSAWEAAYAGGDVAQKMLAPWLSMMQSLAKPGRAFPEATLAFDRTYGALADALGFGPLRKLQGAWQDAVEAGIAQQDARARYAVLVQRALAQGYERTLRQLADKASADERIESVLALLRLWAVATEEAVHEVLQSEDGLAATAALTRAALAYRKKMREVADILAGMLDVATRSDVDLAYKEIQALKREVRELRRHATRRKTR